MKLYKLTQKEYGWFDKAYSMVVSAESEQQARELAKINEDNKRDGEQLWNEKNAICEEISLPEKTARVFVVI